MPRPILAPRKAPASLHPRRRSMRPGLEGLESRALLTTLIALSDQNSLLTFDSATPATIASTTPVTGLTSGESLIGIDVPPSTGALLGLGSQSHVYTINPSTGAATLVSATAFAPSLIGSNFGFDVNPTTDKIRIVDDSDQNLRVDPTTGIATSDATLAYAVGDPHNGSVPNVVAIAHTNNVANSPATTLYGIDSTLGLLVRIGSINGAPNSPDSGQVITVGPLGLNVKDAIGFDVTGVTNTAYAALTPTSGTSPSLYTIDLTTGTATRVGTIGTGATHVLALAASIAAIPTPPAAPSAPTLATASDSGVSNTDHITNVKNPVIQGTAIPGDMVSILVNGAVSGQAAAGPSGSYSITIGPLADGTYSIQAEQTDPGTGLTSAPSAAMSPALVIVTSAPAPGVPTLYSQDDTGFSSTDNFTRVSSPRFVGSGVPGDTVTVFVNGSAAVQGVVATFGEYGVQIPQLGDGQYQITANQTDLAGNVSPMTSATTPALVIDNSSRPTPAEAFVGRLYRDLLGRPADQNALDHWTPLVNQANGRILVVQGILGSLEYRQRVVNSDYQSILHRAADPNSLTAASNYLVNHSNQQLVAFLAGTSEYYQNHGGTTDGYISGVFQDLLGRPVDATGHAYAVSILNAGGSRQYLAYALLTSSEGYAHSTTNYFQSLVGFTPDAASIANVQNLYNHGGRNEDVITILATTDTYFRAARGSDLLINQWGTQVYLDLLGRPADPAGLAALKGLLDQGRTTTQAVQTLQNTDEYRAKLVTDAYNSVLRHAPDPAGLAAAQAYLAGGGTIEAIRANLYASNEYFTNIGTGTNAGFVAAVYQDVLGRPADPAGAAAATQQLGQGLSRSSLAAYLMNTVEGTQHTIQGLYLTYLRRVPSYPELSAISANLSTGVTRDQDIVAYLVGSPEYFADL